jgi:hypothetical protein
MRAVEVALFLYILSTTKAMNAALPSSEAWVTGTKVEWQVFFGTLG